MLSLGANCTIGLAALDLRERLAVFDTMIFPSPRPVDALSSESNCPELVTLIVLPGVLTDEVVLVREEV